MNWTLSKKLMSMSSVMPLPGPPEGAQRTIGEFTYSDRKVLFLIVARFQTGILLARLGIVSVLRNFGSPSSLLQELRE
jgi:hypothetical protein